jgi:hypothetical protein
MRTMKLNPFFVASVLLATTLGGHAQSSKSDPSLEGPKLDIAVTYQAMYSNPVNGGDNFWLQGGSAQIHGQFWRGLGAVAEVAGLHTGDANSGVGLDIVTVTFGPRYTWLVPKKRFSVYGQALVGEAFGMNSVFPGANTTTDSANSLALALGGGVNYPLKHGFSLRPLEADWVRTQMPNAVDNVQNNLRLGAGVVLHIQ